MFWLIVTIIIWGAVHSAMASLSFKKTLHNQLGIGFAKYYRLLYNLFAVVSLTPVLYLLLILPDRSLYQISDPWNIIMRAGQLLSTVLLLIALLQTDVLSFIGLRQLLGEMKNEKLITTGLYRYMRHPLYTFGLLTLWLSPAMSLNLFVVYVMFTLYLLTGIVFEERKLLREFGAAYADYRSSTPMLIPGLTLGRNKKATASVS